MPGPRPCEPVGLGVAVRRRWPSSPVEVLLDTDRPVLLDHCSDGEREWRAVVQRASRTDAGRLGVPIRSRRLSLDGLRGAVGRGEHVLLLVSPAAMQGFDVPHWVLCHAVVPGAVVPEDPWCNTGAGDTWADTHLLPVADASLDAMSLLTDHPFRGAVRIGRPARRD
ncbi:peptidase C39 family protein [Streptomyces olivaceus]|uniref:peptidase C39 family protein n=1 Tax=Streptomyces olivaceus TaxID=47716 RepID=UPI0035560066